MATTQGKETRQEEDRDGYTEVGFSRVQKTPKCIEGINFMAFKNSGLLTKDDMETKEDKEVAFEGVNQNLNGS